MRLLALFLLLPAAALAQSSNIIRPLVGSRGVTLPPESTAIVDEASALSINPGSLRFVDGPQLLFVYERNRLQDQVGNGLFASSSLFRFLGVGYGLEWIHNETEPDYRRASFGFSLGTDTLALGATHHAFASEDASIDKLSSWDIGLSARPSRKIAYSVVARDINEPEQGAYRLTRTFDVGIGFRPFGERYTLGADYLFRSGGLDEGRMNYALKAEVRPGVLLSAGAPWRAGGGAPAGRHAEHLALRRHLRSGRHERWPGPRPDGAPVGRPLSLPGCVRGRGGDAGSQ
jgi:protease IV